jgi:hypothetical protein
MAWHLSTGMNLRSYLSIKVYYIQVLFGAIDVDIL